MVVIFNLMIYTKKCMCVPYLKNEQFFSYLSLMLNNNHSDTHCNLAYKCCSCYN